MKKSLLLMISLALSCFMMAQTPGLIVKPAGTGATVLDPDGDGYVSQKTDGQQIGFTIPPNSDFTQSEIPYAPIVKKDTIADLLQGPDCHFSEIVGTDLTDQYAILAYFDGTNLMFRMRMANYVPNSKTYSILIDTDTKYGFTGPNADPNAVPGNPGFEVEIAMITNFGVNVYNIDGTTDPIMTASNDYDTHSQMSVALSSFCDSPDYFYDFYVPFSQLEAIPGLNITTATPLRFSFNTNMKPDASTGSNSISDEAGIPDDQNPTSVDSINEGVDEITDCPPVNQVYTASTAITGYSDEVDGTVVNVYIYAEDGVSLLSTGTTTVSTGSWSVNISSFSPSVALAEGYVIKATATAPDKATSFDNCDVEVVFFCSEDTPVPTSDEVKKLFNGNGYQITTDRPRGTLVYIYNQDHTLLDVSGLWNMVNPYSTSSSPETFNFECKVSGCFDGQVYIFRMEEPGMCISDEYFSCDYAGAVASAEPVINSIPVTVNTTVLEGTATSASAQLLIYINGEYEAAVTANATAPYSFSSPVSGLELGDTIEVRQIEDGKCVSDPVMVLVTRQAYPPLLTTSPCIDTDNIDSISGTSVEAAGTEITVFQLNPARTELGTTTVQSDGSWTLSGLYLVEGDQVTAAVTDGLYLTQSVDGDTITLVRMSNISNYTIEIGTLTEGDLGVLGAISGASYPVTLSIYVDDAFIGQVTVNSPGDWTVSGLNSYDLNTGSVVNVAIEREGECQSAYSATSAVVMCAAPAAFTISSDTTHICEGSAAVIYVDNSELGVYYEPVLASDSSTFGYGKIGTGGTIELNTYLVTDSVDITVMASTIPVGSCVIYADSAISFAFIDSLYAPVASHEQTLCYNSLVDDISVLLNGYGAINWYSSPISDTPLDPSTLVEDGVTYYAEARTNGCYSEDRTAVTVYLDIVPDTSYWTGDYNNDFNNDLNWTKGSPGYCSYAIIPSLEGRFYPIIYDSAAVDVIYFESGGAVLGLQNLVYNRAYVDVTFDINQWYTITAPLKEMFSGDYYYYGSPQTYMQLFDQINPDDYGSGEVTVGTWTNSFANLTVPLDPGLGYAFLVDSFNFNYPDKVFYSDEPFTLTFPRENEDGSLLTSYALISSLTGKIYYQYTRDVSKDSYSAYRFAMEDENNVLQDVNVPIKPGLNLVGNPLMSHLDFKKLYASNSSVISNKVKFWNGTTFTTYMVGEEIASDMDLDYTIIPPMQSFFVEGLTTGTMLIDLDAHFVADTLTQLRSASTTVCPVMHIEASMGDYRSSTAIAFDSAANNGFDSKDAFKLFTFYSEVPEVYTLAGSYPVDINQFSQLPYMTSLAIRTTAKGNINLEFEGVESFAGMDVTLLNTATGEQQNLKLDDDYTFYSSGVDMDGMLFIEFKQAVTTGFEEPEVCYGECVSVFAKDNHVYLSSPPNEEIMNFTIWEESGTQLYRNYNLNACSFDILLETESPICVARVETKERVYVVKLIMK